MSNPCWLLAAVAFSGAHAFFTPIGLPAKLQLREARLGSFTPSLRARSQRLGRSRFQLRSPVIMSGVADDGEEESRTPDEQVGGLMGMPPSFFRSDNGTRDEEFAALSTFTGSKKAERYVQLVASLTPAETVGQFMNTAPPRVQSAMKETILSLFGSLGDTPAFDASVVTTKKAMGSLFYQMEMTGYMFRNAEYRKSLERSINVAMLEGSGQTSAPDETVVQGNITVKVGDQEEVNVDAGSYVSDLQREVEQLRAEMAAMKERELKQDETASVVQYIQQLSADEIKKLSENISPEVVEAMQHLVKVVMRGVSGPDLPPMLTAALGADPGDMVTELPSGVLAQLCMWQRETLTPAHAQLVVGYNLREIEARDAFNQQLGK